MGASTMSSAKAEASFLLFARQWLYKHQQIGGHTRIVPRSCANLILGSRPLASKASSKWKEPSISTAKTACGSYDRRYQEQEDLWQQLFLDPTTWWDNRRDKVSARAPDFRRKGSGEVLWLDSLFKPAWVDEQLVSLDMQKRPGTSPPKSSPQHKPGTARRTGTQMGVATTDSVNALCQQGKLCEAVGALESLVHTGSGVSQSLLYTLLKSCTAKKDLAVGQRVHDLIIKLGYDSSPYLGNHILRMYACGGRLQEAMGVFTRVEKPDAFMWCSIISAYAKHGKPEQAIQLYHEMRRSGAKADAHVFVAVLQACALAADLESGKKVHCDLLHSGIPINLFVGSGLVDMYAKCGKMKDARQVFDNMAAKDVVTWNSLIAGYTQQGFGDEALFLYGQMEEGGLILANHITFCCLLKACANTGALQQGKQLHSLIVKRGLRDNLVVGTCLVDMYAKCGDMKDARQVFDSMKSRDVVTWNALIAGYAHQGFYQEAFLACKEMEEVALIPADSVTFCCLLKACGSSGKAALQEGKQLHSQIVERGLLAEVVVGNCLVDMYAKCGELEVAKQIFNSMNTKDVVTWTTLIAGYAQQGLGKEALFVYGQMEEAGLILADSLTFCCLLRACGSSGALQKGKQLHSQIAKRGLLDNVVVGTCLVDMYAKCGELDDAREMSNSMNTKDVKTWTALVDGYVKCGNMKDARQVFDSMSSKDVVTWTALIAGYAHQGLCQDALDVYGQMEEGGLILADGSTFACLLKACASTGALQKGRQLHSQIAKRGLLDDVVVGSNMVTMYAKCGEMEEARKMFDSMSSKDVVTWNALIAGYGACDEGHKALACFEEMLVAGILPDDETFTCLLVACSHAGLVEEGRKHFDSMAGQHGIKPTMQHYNCMIDLFGRSGHLDEAEKMLLSCEGQSNAVGLRALLNACKSYKDVERAERCFKSIVSLNPPEMASAYVLMANVYADAGRWADVERIETQRKAAGANKKPAVATIEVKKEVHSFAVGERTEELAAKAASIYARLKKEGGHIPHTKLVLKPMREKEKEDALCGHAEKLALAFGLLNTPSGTPLVVTKNLRMCSDCHSSTEIMSRLEQRNIVVRDGYRVHRFADGCCSCNGRP